MGTKQANIGTGGQLMAAFSSMFKTSTPKLDFAAAAKVMSSPAPSWKPFGRQP